jgi:hypothetical protein
MGNEDPSPDLRNVRTTTGTRRRHWLGAFASALMAPGGRAARASEPVTADALLEDLERRSFRFFWDTTDPRTGLTPDRYPTPSFASIGAVGFALTAYPIGVTRGWVGRAQAVARVLATLQFFHDAPQGAQPTGQAGYRGFFYHFIDMGTGARFAQCELSTIDTALLMAGMLACQAFFDGAGADEARVRRLVDEIYGRVDWRWAQRRDPLLCKGWRPETGFLAEDWNGYDEASFLYLLAMGANRRPISARAWEAWCSTYEQGWGGRRWGQPHLTFAPLFGHQFTQCWYDLRHSVDPWMAAKGIDYFENSRRATYAQRAYAIANPEGWNSYGANVWGISACDGPLDVKLPYAGRTRTFSSYAGRGMGGGMRFDDGTIAPYAAGSSLPFAPEIVKPALLEMHARFGAEIYGPYGFFAFNPSFRYANVKLRHGRLTASAGWVDTDYLGVEVGPLLLMLANHRDELVWTLMRKSAAVRRGLERAGFQGGWLA